MVMALARNVSERASARGAMSVAEENAIAEEKKTGYGEDSTDSDNETEKKALLRRMSTSKCVGRLVSCDCLVTVCFGSYSAYVWACHLSVRGAEGAMCPGRER
ncbi:unnamed protein product [Euphydryas editha]|uniref:Uncharacterized protein n=1 Tax=Euphydryas editha TaxID=104508 RepID=A0AAU9UNY0_EUPED|nr:unnamed protein product [Euphydryas editha]